jgi:hypothetical protein
MFASCSVLLGDGLNVRPAASPSHITPLAPHSLSSANLKRAFRHTKARVYAGIDAGDIATTREVLHEAKAEG